MREVSARSGVAKQTLYNIFESRDNLIMAAINYHFSASEIDTEYMTPPAPV